MWQASAVCTQPCALCSRPAGRSTRRRLALSAACAPARCQQRGSLLGRCLPAFPARQGQGCPGWWQPRLPPLVLAPFHRAPARGHRPFNPTSLRGVARQPLCRPPACPARGPTAATRPVLVLPPGHCVNTRCCEVKRCELRVQQRALLRSTPGRCAGPPAHTPCRAKGDERCGLSCSGYLARKLPGYALQRAPAKRGGKREK